MPQHIQYYFDYKSPYAYLANADVYKLEQAGVRVEWLPFVLHIPDAFGDVDNRDQRQWNKVRYLYMDVRRFANQRGLVVRGPKKIFDSTLISEACLFVQEVGAFKPFNDRVFERFWQRELDIEDDGAVCRVLEECGLDADGFQAFRARSGTAQLAAIRAQAEEAGVFGVPTFVHDGELFWGYDRLALLRIKLGLSE